MAAAELLLTPRETDNRPGSSLYFYARETVGVAVTLDDRVHTPANGPGSIAHLPTGSQVECPCGRRGCLEVTVGERELLARAVRHGILPKPEAHRRPRIADLYRAADTDAAARDLLAQRAEILGRTAALIRDMFNPDRVILGGQAFTGYQPGIARVARAFRGNTSLPDADLRISRFGARVQESAAAVTSLSVVYADPLAALRRAVRTR